MVDHTKLPKQIGNQRFTFVNALQDQSERRRKYRLLRDRGFSVEEALAMRDYRQVILDKRLAILELANKY